MSSSPICQTNDPLFVAAGATRRLTGDNMGSLHTAVKCQTTTGPGSVLSPPSHRTGAVVHQRLRELVAEWLERGMREGRTAPAGGWKQTSLAERSGVSRQHINGILNQTSEPGDDVLARLAAALEYPLPQLVWSDDPPAYERGRLEGWRLALRTMREWNEVMDGAGPPRRAAEVAAVSRGRVSPSGAVDATALVELTALLRRYAAPAAASEGSAPAEPAAPGASRPRRRAGES